jgi:hypothetical protein
MNDQRMSTFQFKHLSAAANSSSPRFIFDFFIDEMFQDLSDKSIHNETIKSSIKLHKNFSIFDVKLKSSLKRNYRNEMKDHQHHRLLVYAK